MSVRLVIYAEHIRSENTKAFFDISSKNLCESWFQKALSYAVYYIIYVGSGYCKIC